MISRSTLRINLLVTTTQAKAFPDHRLRDVYIDYDIFIIITPRIPGNLNLMRGLMHSVKSTIEQSQYAPSFWAHMLLSTKPDPIGQSDQIAPSRGAAQSL
jgi:hypothetical protein